MICSTCRRVQSALAERDGLRCHCAYSHSPSASVRFQWLMLGAPGTGFRVGQRFRGHDAYVNVACIMVITGGEKPAYIRQGCHRPVRPMDDWSWRVNIKFDSRYIPHRKDFLLASSYGHIQISPRVTRLVSANHVFHSVCTMYDLVST